jgi:hypothetical protein
MQRRDAVLRALKGHPISQRQACVLIGVDPKTVRRECVFRVMVGIDFAGSWAVISREAGH